MADWYLFADEAGNFDFSTRQGASSHVVLCTVALSDCSIGTELLELRRDLAWRGINLDRVFHASEELQSVRDEVFQLLETHEFRIDATIFEKRKTQPHLQNQETFYQMAWWLHFKHCAPRILAAGDRMQITAASLGTRKEKAIFHRAVQRVARQVLVGLTHRVAFWPYESDPCLQVADYCTWAIQRKWQGGDPRSHVLIEDKIKSEYDVWAIGTTYYY